MGRTKTISRECYVFRPYIVFIAFMASFCCSLPVLSQPDKVVRIEAILGVTDRSTYVRELLSTALNLGLPPSEHMKLKEYYGGSGVSSARKAIMLMQGKYDLIWAPPRADLEKNALRVNFPFLRGLRGYRIMFAHKDSRELLSKARNKEGLMKLVAGLGIGWTDVDVFYENSLPTLTAPTHDDLWRMLAAKRFDYYPRGLGEILIEWGHRRKEYPSIEIDQSLIIQYPFPLFFYVRPGRPDLQKRMTENLLKFYESGDFLKLWAEKHRTVIKKLNLANRHTIRLQTSHLSAIEGDWPKHIMISPEELLQLGQ